MNEPLYSFVFDLIEARKSFLVSTDHMVLALLASVEPAAEWDGCEVFIGDSPGDPLRTACVAVRGASADRVQVAIIEAFERVGIPVLDVYDGAPDAKKVLAKAKDGRWEAD